MPVPELLAIFAAMFTVLTAVVGATWVLRTKLADIEMALKSHITEMHELTHEHSIKLDEKYNELRTRVTILEAKG